MLSYFRPLRFQDYTLSVDKVVIDYILAFRKPQALMNFLSESCFKYCVELTHWNSFKIGTYREQFTIDFPDGESFWIGSGLNEVSTHYGKTRIEFNPNKVARHECFLQTLSFLNTACKPIHTQVRRYDLAIDYPCLRENAFLIKDNRKYGEFRISESDRTQYLGKASNAGYVKLYNKQIESDLSSPLTRLELTLDGGQEYEDIHFPTVYFVNDMSVHFDEIRLCGTDRFILDTLLHEPDKIVMLERKMRKKMELLLSSYVTEFSLSKTHFKQIQGQVRDFIRFPSVPLTDTEERSLVSDSLQNRYDWKSWVFDAMRAEEIDEQEGDA